MRRLLPSPLEVILSVFLTKKVSSVSVPALVRAYLTAYPDHGATVEDAWASLEALEKTGILERCAVPILAVDISDRPLCPKASNRSVFAVARLRLPLDDAAALAPAPKSYGRTPRQDRQPDSQEPHAPIAICA